MHIPEPPYPSTALVPSNTVGQDSLRLPAYRAGHLGRYHPYPRLGRPVDRPMETVDYRDIEAFEYLSVSPAITGAQAEFTNVDVANLDLALHADIEAAAKGRRTLSSLVIDLALVFRRQCQHTRKLKLLLPPYKSQSRR
ncbi:hypothetical protein OBBRIDRAFT_319529 [Obba rivulosa]|uniref:Uncharacterized protein n=1 Tax=Obba rivulosa TaxID=1052685 RepID=A0A8E2DPM2_9APHY|nr:hypothetical protein OBBRIDRAFT_319529 [Obba rivulosa]